MCVYLCTALPVIRKLKSIYTVYNINIGKSTFYRLKKYAHLFAHRPDFFCNEGTHNVKIQYKYFTLHSANHTTAVPKRANKPSCTPLRD